MGSSAKKKKEKKKDFQKPKLKVGKARPKPVNSTDTSFRSKAIVLNQQSLTTDQPSSSSQVKHHVSLLTSKSDSQRKESLAYLKTYFSTKRGSEEGSVAILTILEKACPLLLDASSGVRNQFLKLLQALPDEDIQDHIAKILPYIRAALTHLSSDIRKSALDTISWLLTVAGTQLVSCPGGWTKTLESCVTGLGWQSTQDTTQWKTGKVSFRNDVKATSLSIQVLDQLIKVATSYDKISDTSNDVAANFPLWDFTQHQIATKSEPYSHLGLFGTRIDDESRMVEDPEERIELLRSRFYQSIAANLDVARKEGGDIGRAAGSLAKTLDLVAVES